MLKQYSILSKCLAELKTSDLPIIEKLKIEVQLIQTKRILLDYRVEQKVTGVASSEKDFNDLYEQVRYACNAGGIGGVDLVKAHILEIKDCLNQEPTGKTPYLTQQAPENLRTQSVLRKPLHSIKDILARQ
jgi:small ligand-binding sensory domain FIST